MNRQKYENTQKRLGIAHSFILRDVKRWLDEKANNEDGQKVLLYDIRKYVEQRVHTLVRGPNGA